MWQYRYTDELYHYGVKGMKWGHRKRYPTISTGGRRAARVAANQSIASDRARTQQMKAAYKQQLKEYRQTDEAKAARKAKTKKALKVGAAVAGTALAAYGAYKLNDYVKTKNCQIAAKNGRDWAEQRFRNDLQSKGWEKMLEGANSGRITINSGSGAAARDAANRASRDSFRTAAKNVVDYKKSGGNLKALSSVDFLSSLPDSSIVLEKKKR